MDNLILVSLSLSSLLSFLSYCILLSVLNFFAFCIDYGLLLTLIHRYPLSTLPRFMWSARMGYPVPFTLSLTELTFVSYVTVYAIGETVSYFNPSLWPLYFLIFLVQRISRLSVLLRSPMLSIPSPDMSVFGDGHSAAADPNVIQPLHVEHSRHTAISVALCVLCFVIWVHVSCILHWIELAHHELVCQSFLVCIYTSTLIQSIGLLAYLRIGSVSAPQVNDTTQLNLPKLFLHLIPASLLPYFWSPLSGPARFQWVAELFMLLFVHLYDRYQYDYNPHGLDWPPNTVPAAIRQSELVDRSKFYCALCLRPRHRPLVAFASQLDPSEPALPCTHPVHQACYRIWQAIAPYCTRCKELKALMWLAQTASKTRLDPSQFDRTDADADEQAASESETEHGQASSRSWSSDSLNHVSSSLLSSSSDLSVYDDKEIDLRVYLDRWTDLERGARDSSHACDSSSSDAMDYDYPPAPPPSRPSSTPANRPLESDMTDPKFWIPSD